MAQSSTAPLKTLWCKGATPPARAPAATRSGAAPSRTSSTQSCGTTRAESSPWPTPARIPTSSSSTSSTRAPPTSTTSTPSLPPSSAASTPSPRWSAPPPTPRTDPPVTASKSSKPPFLRTRSKRRTRRRRRRSAKPMRTRRRGSAARRGWGPKAGRGGATPPKPPESSQPSLPTAKPRASDVTSKQQPPHRLRSPSKTIKRRRQRRSPNSIRDPPLALSMRGSRYVFSTHVASCFEE
mmetsp:Transcript_29854/g.97217  ORF Transcript_29854/g.97217 Transcript_29854/m.97217 type:complete len:238 (-) Transcript_29854:425-1138(-)